ncbi:MAG: DUF4062 domain-containing protein [Flavobacteriales bacterium]
MPRKQSRGKLKIMVASSVHHFRTELDQIYATLRGFGYEVIMSKEGTVFVDPRNHNRTNCIQAVHECDVFLGIIRPNYGSGIVSGKAITHWEFLEAIKLNRPSWFVVDQQVETCRQLLKPYLFRKKGKRTVRTDFRLRPNPVLDDLRVLDMYESALKSNIKLEERTGHWVQPYADFAQLLTFIDRQFKDPHRIRTICEDQQVQP